MPSDGSPSRRRFLAALGVAATGGCLDGVPSLDGRSGPGETVTPSGGTTVLGYDAGAARDPADWSRYDEDWSAPTTSPLATGLTTETLVENLEIIWDLSFADDGTLFLTERVGRVRKFHDGNLETVAEPGDAIDGGTARDSWWVDGGEGGTLGTAVHPNYPDPPLLYVYYTYQTVEGRRNKVEVFDASASNPNDERETIVREIPADLYHNGGRITFGPEGNLWITCGDAGTRENANDRSSLAGKVLRVTPAGDPAPGNPVPDDEAADARVFTYGHRNPQCITFMPDGTPVAAEHGPNARDEVNHLVAGDYYGWPEFRKRDEYGGASGVHQPVTNSGRTTWAPSGGVFYTGDGVPALSNRLLNGCLRGQQLLITTIAPTDAELPPTDDGTRFDQAWTDDDYHATVHTALEDELGRIRHVEQSPGGDVYAVTCNWDGRSEGDFPREGDDRIVRVVPAE